MILGVGTDIVEIGRIAKAVENRRFLEKYFTKGELEFFSKKKICSVAGNFACKESVAKALGTGFVKFLPGDIEVLRDENGKPCVNLYNGALDRFLELGAKNVHASISHSREYATAVVVIES